MAVATRMYCVAERTSGNPIVIVGGGLAGGNAAATVREEGFPGPVVLISREPGVPFGRPPLSKTYLRSEEDLAGWYVRPASWYADHDVELRSGPSVVAVDPAAHTVTLDSGEELTYHKVLIATGGRNRRLAIPGAGLPGIHYLRTVAECDAIKQEAMAGPARGRRRHGIHRLRGGGLADAARRPGDRGLPRPGSAGDGSWAARSAR